MRRKEREITDQKLLEEILIKSTVCRIAINDNEYPYIVALNYGYSNNALYIHCAKAGKKIDLLKANNKVSFQIEYGSEIIKHEESCKWTTKYRSVVGVGEIEILTEFSDKIHGLNILMEHSGKLNNEYNSKAVDHILILKLNIKQLTGKQAGDWE
ncbi:pyridoxamine 5'-phosphate oxidase family protein [Marinifilum sp. N1E240]|uniref:pyridoxamine 5'-phosphate oxidase family protein n=1 Tax=Marinifilum sp. N1E240 TaxID=2608082 RepID=UPI00128B8399|nr:pyridoxamine 5'-phosphate oxidase family protein [Marinifilum sp. N1E240]MPQ47520.1 pyridoxamine 5'-phosphate oxidase family protein [Marinifilum sp. N1E240]